MKQIEQTTGPTTGSLVGRLVKNFGEHGFVPDPDTLLLAGVADGFADGTLDADALQVALLQHIDRLALKSQLLSRSVRRWKEPPIADDMTCALTMVMDGVVRSPRFAPEGLRVSSEENYRLVVGGVRKPDVAVWRGSKLVAIVECKTCLSYSRKTWEEDYTKRAEEFAANGLDPRGVIYVVASEHGWSGFDPKDPRTGTVWFSLAGKKFWFGGGKTGEAPISEGANPGIMSRMVDSLASLLVNVNNNGNCVE